MPKILESLLQRQRWRRVSLCFFKDDRIPQLIALDVGGRR